MRVNHLGETLNQEPSEIEFDISFPEIIKARQGYIELFEDFELDKKGVENLIKGLQLALDYGWLTPPVRDTKNSQEG